eukprot:766976-Hanusia_phi.AAC.10
MKVPAEVDEARNETGRLLLHVVSMYVARPRNRILRHPLERTPHPLHERPRVLAGRRDREDEMAEEPQVGGGEARTAGLEEGAGILQEEASGRFVACGEDEEQSVEDGILEVGERKRLLRPSTRPSALLVAVGQNLCVLLLRLLHLCEQLSVPGGESWRCAGSLAEAKETHHPAEVIDSLQAIRRQARQAQRRKHHDRKRREGKEERGRKGREGRGRRSRSRELHQHPEAFA